jgi:hypothetical protein
MEEIVRGLYLGSDEDVPEAKKRGYARLTAAKDGPDGHRSILGYTTLGAPKGKDYLFARKNDHAAMNLIDVEDPEFISDEMLDDGLAFIHEMMSEGKKILVHCNAGMSRGPTMVLMYLRTIGELDQPFNRAKHIFKTLYPKYDPGHGMLFHAMSRWDELKGIYATRHHERGSGT